MNIEIDAFILIPDISEDKVAEFSEKLNDFLVEEGYGNSDAEGALKSVVVIKPMDVPEDTTPSKWLAEVSSGALMVVLPSSDQEFIDRVLGGQG
jgi:hypothetical protein